MEAPIFEQSIALIQKKKSHEFSTVHHAAVTMLRAVSRHEGFSTMFSSNEGCNPRKIMLVERALKRKKQVVEGDRGYIDACFIRPTSNVMESFFSRAGHALKDRLRGLLPVNLELQKFLFTNADRWGVTDVSQVM